jgi:leucyl aminopeptidase
VGKGLTFDSGGISIKPSAAMEEMKYDMCGGAAVIGTMLALARLKAKVNVIGLVPSTENMPGSQAVKPGDVYFARNGKSVEVFNTDAEGRLILGDALAYGTEQNPVAMFDAATLTGAILVALGNTYTGVFTRDRKLMRRVQDAADISGEWVWGMPLDDFHSDDMRGHHADLCNISSGRLAGSSTAAAFLEEFVGKDVPWAHFDIAGTAWNVNSRLPYHPRKGASGVIMRTFVELAQSF